MTPEFITAIAGLISVVVIGIGGLRYLADIRSDLKVAGRTIAAIEQDVDEMRKEVREDSTRQWSKLSDHDIAIAELKISTARGK